MISLICGIQTKQMSKQKALIDTESRFVIARGGKEGWDKVGEGSQKLQTSSYRTSQSRRRGGQHDNYGW